MTLRRKISLAAAGILIAPLLLLVEEHFRGKWALERWQARMTAQGEKFQVEQLLPPAIDERDNGMGALVLAAGQLQSNPIVWWQIMPSSFHFAAPGAVVYIVG